MNNDMQEFDGSSWVHRHVMRHFRVGPQGKPSYYLGEVIQATPPNDVDQPWIFRVAYEDGAEADLNYAEAEADLLPARPDNTLALEETPDWILLKKVYESIRQNLLMSTFSHRSDACMRSIFSFRPNTAITEKAVKRSLQDRSKKLHPDKVTQRPARVKHLAKKIYYALKYLYDSMVQDTWHANDRSVDDCPTIDDYPEYHTEAFARAASTAAEQVTLEDLTPADADEDPQHDNTPRRHYRQHIPGHRRTPPRRLPILQPPTRGMGP